jgi:uncharacterized iron-regulated membrane protein
MFVVGVFWPVLFWLFFGGGVLVLVDDIEELVGREETTVVLRVLGESDSGSSCA